MQLCTHFALCSLRLRACGWHVSRYSLPLLSGWTFRLRLAENLDHYPSATFASWLRILPTAAHTGGRAGGRAVRNPDDYRWPLPPPA